MFEGGSSFEKMRLNTAGRLGLIKGQVFDLDVWGDKLFDSFHPFNIWVEKASHGLDLSTIESQSTPDGSSHSSLDHSMFFCCLLINPFNNESIHLPPLAGWWWLWERTLVL